MVRAGSWLGLMDEDATFLAGCYEIGVNELRSRAHFSQYGVPGVLDLSRIGVRTSDELLIADGRIDEIVLDDEYSFA